MSGRKSPPVSYSTGREVGLLDTQVLEKLQETFLYRQFYFCHYIIPSFLKLGTGSLGTARPRAALYSNVPRPG